MIQEFKTSKGEFLLVKVPGISTGFCIETGYLFCDNTPDNTWNLHERIKLSEGHWEIVGDINSLSNDKLQSIVDTYKNGHNEIGYPYYIKDGIDDDINCAFITEKQSFESLLVSLEVYSEKPDECSNHWCENGKIDCGYNEYMNCIICEDIEKRTGKWILLKKIL